MRLRYSPLSPFVRKVRVAAIELGLDDQIERVPTDVWSADTDIARDNPLGKVPALVSEDGVFAGSTLICQYLDARAGRRLFPPPGDGWAVLQLHALADGMMEAAVQRTIETMRRPQELVYPEFVARQEGKILGTLDAIETRGELDGGQVDIATLTTACSLAYLDLRASHLDWRRQRPRLSAFYDAFADRASMKATAPQPA